MGFYCLKLLKTALSMIYQNLHNCNVFGTHLLVHMQKIAIEMENFVKMHLLPRKISPALMRFILPSTRCRKPKTQLFPFSLSLRFINFSIK